MLCLVGLSAWPNLVSGHAFGAQNPKAQVQTGFRLASVPLQPAHGTLTVTSAAACEAQPCSFVTFRGGGGLFIGAVRK